MVGFKSVLLLYVYCAVRPGEILKALREDALLPGNCSNCLYAAGSNTVFPKVKLPKTRRRGARIQHFKRTVEPVVRFLETALGPLRREECVVSGSLSSFCRTCGILFSSRSRSLAAPR